MTERRFLNGALAVFSSSFDPAKTVPTADG